MKIFLKIVSVVVVLYAGRVLFTLSDKWPGINIKIGWGGNCWGPPFPGFPFTRMSCPQALVYCPCSSNGIAIWLDYFFWVGLLFLLLYGIKKFYYFLKAKR